MFFISRGNPFWALFKGKPKERPPICGVPLGKTIILVICGWILGCKRPPFGVLSLREICETWPWPHVSLRRPAPAPSMRGAGPHPQEGGRFFTSSKMSQTKPTATLLLETLQTVPNCFTIPMSLSVGSKLGIGGVCLKRYNGPTS